MLRRVYNALRNVDEPSRYMEFNILMVRFMGVLVNRGMPGALLTWSLLALLLSQGLAGVLDLYENHSDIADITANLPVTTIVFSSAYRLFFFTLHRDRYQAIVDTVGDRFVASSSSINMAPWLRRSRIISILYFTYGSFVASTWQLHPLISAQLTSAEMRKESNGTFEGLPRELWEFPFRAQYPFDARQPYVYTVVFLLQGACIFVSGCMIVVLDMMFITLTLLICGQLEILKDKLQNMRNIATDQRQNEDIGLVGKALEKQALERRKMILNSSTDITKQDENFNEDLVTKKINLLLGECVEHHNMLLSMISEIEFMHWSAFMINFCVLLIIFSFAAFEVTSGTPTSPAKVVNLAEYLLVSILQMFLLCDCGDKLVDQELSVSQAAYESEWYHCSESVKRTLQIIVLRARQPEQITVGKIAGLNLDTFSDMLSRSFSYFTVLRQIRDG
ncbi:odorant receptor coreceptor-like [Schistocerca piceifrons]|uniref:odorant receptor coreceptor-like n=2 Tax=Schistocerca TaxID=7008 RepID=UPI001F5EB4FC|nr:odorant receptor coreceptor-like [Schistocerca piceifrons]